MKLVGLSGSLIGSKTVHSVQAVLLAANNVDPSIEIELLDLKDYEVEFVKGTPLSYYNQDTNHVVKTILSADFIVIGTPVYQSSITGALKNVLDHLPIDAFNSKVTGIVTTAGTDKHYLVAEYHLKPILAYLKGIIPIGNVFIHSDHFNEDNEIIDSDVKKRISHLAKEMILLQNNIRKEKTN